MIFDTLLYLGGIGSQELVILLVPVVLWAWAIIDLVSDNFENSINKLVWLLVILFVPVIGCILYLIIGRGQKVKSA